MPLPTGARIGPYEVTGTLGAGGMGEVYRARDTRLGRDVALKIIPDTLAGDADHLARFHREAQVLASLNHPNIAHLYGLEDVASTSQAGPAHALVMELVDGPTLADRIAAGPMPINEALPIARQIAEALEAAHDHGIVHRDLKPANIKVRADGTVKVLDFGLAKALSPDGPGATADAMHSPTLTARATQVGTIIGTAAYMSPEQARGKAVDRRADVWAFGVVLFEMLTGRRAFDGAEISDVLAAVLRQELDWSSLPPSTPSPIRRLLRRCLERESRERLADMSTARLEIQEALSGKPEAATPPIVDRPGRNVWALVATAAATAVVVGAAAWAWWRPAPAAPPRVIRTMIPFPPGMTALFDEGFVGSVAVSATHVAFVAGPARQLFLRALDRPDAVAVNGGTDASGPVFSPDGRWIAFFSGGRLKKAAVGDGPMSDLCAAADPTGASWGADDVIVFGDFEKGILTVPAAGGTPRLVVESAKDHLVLEPSWLPGGTAILFSSMTRIGRFDADVTTAKLQIRPIAEGSPPLVLTDGYRARFTTSGYLTVMRGSALVGMPFDMATHAVTGGAETLVTDVARSSYDISVDGSLAYLPGTLEAPRTFVWLDRKGQIEPTGIPPQIYAYPRISPDGTRIVVDTRQDERDLWIWNIRQKTLSRLTSERGQDAYAVWTPDSSRIIYGAPTAGAEENLAVRAADGTGAIDNLLASPRHQTPYSLSPDGAWLVFRDEVDGEGTNIGLLQIKDRQAKPLIATRFNERNAEISPDGRQMAYQSDDGGAMEIFVRPFPEIDAGKVQVSNGGGIRPVWSRNGRELFYLAEAGGSPVLKRVERGSGALEFSPPVTLLDVSAFHFGTFLGRTYDVAADGRFLVQRIESKTSATGPPGVSLVLNWIEELKKK